ncbi:hypothetical protein, partial [Salmonella enterica]|uniref:hypothetical protein n=1 Tax=Salmonella enterica TaxID=28901 RepID=UPI002666DBBC
SSLVGRVDIVFASFVRRGYFFIDALVGRVLIVIAAIVGLGDVAAIVGLGDVADIIGLWGGI